MIRRISLAFIAALALSVGIARAAIVETYSTSAAFLLDFATPDTVTFGPGGPAPLLDLTGFAQSATSGVATFSADTGGLFGASTILSTEIDGAALLVSFAQPLTAVGLFALITDEDFDAVGGTLGIEAVGSGAEDLTVTDTGASFLGLRSDVAFSTLRITVDSYDQNATAVAFASLTDRLFAAASNQRDIPAPGVAALLLPVIALAFARRPRRHG